MKADINLLTNKTLDPASPDYKWEEGGVMASSDGVEDCNAIDPGVFLDPNAKLLWLTYGSYFGYIRLSIGSSAASVWWLNRREVIGSYGDRKTVIDDGVSKRLTLNKGPNIMRAAIVNGGGATDFCARFLDAEDKPLSTGSR